VARILQPRLGEVLGQPLVIENRAGAAGNIGMETAARSAPDGYTLFLGNVGTLAINPAVFSRALKVKPATDFAPVTLVADTPDILVVGPSLPVRTVREFVAEAKAKPGALSYASPGSGSLNRLEMELLRQAEGLDMIHVPYTAGAGQAATDILGGAVAGGFITLSSALGHVQGGRMKGLAVTTARRIPALPDVPTMEESGYPGFVSGSWQGLLAPAGTPPEIIERLHAVTAEALRHPDVVRRYATGGVEPVSSRTPDEFADFMAREARRWGEVAERSGAAAD
jgi:tripartite-type tricarboxylate transporter receptor subunit TctC